ncbi:hypothetical protein MB84_16210 [Pandoraea oxalativorans]|uniref:Uncharacterized protein n=1 Tax=Pandoraea oxalativorans TaxID=573737 RepID=A0A0E3YDM3_9BURK|nr:hypothetical protein MB84_16210 [Pandoraea oxalativorans]
MEKALCDLIRMMELNGTTNMCGRDARWRANMNFRQYPGGMARGMWDQNSDSDCKLSSGVTIIRTD